MGSLLSNDDNELTQQALQTSDGDSIGFPINTSLSINDFTFLAVVGKGKFGKIMKVRKNDDGIIYALKVIKKKKLVQDKQKKLNIKIKRKFISGIDHPFIVSLRYLFQSESKLYMILDFFNAAGDELFFHLKNEGRFSEKRSKFYSGEIFLALKYAHSINIIFADLKPEHILLDNSGHIKLSDFELSADSLKNNRIIHILQYTPYIAPELIQQHDNDEDEFIYDAAVDWWTFGALLYEMMTGLPPKTLSIPKYLSDEAASILTELLHFDTKKRLRSIEIEEHSFYADIDWNKLYKKEYMNNRDIIYVSEYNDGIGASKVDPEFTEEIPTDTLIDKTGSMFTDFTYISESDKISYDTVIMIDDILNGNDESIDLLRRCLICRGWAKIKYPDSINIVIKDVMNNINKWLLETDKNEKLRYSLKLNSGRINPQSEYCYHTINGFKEGIRILTGDLYKIHYKNNKYPSEIMDDILKLNNILDELCIKIMKVIYNKIYSLKSYKEFATIYDISLLNDDQNKFKFGMLDFVNYFNDKEYIEKIRNDEKDEKDENDENPLKPNVLKTDFNVIQHIDPGLFALSFLSTNIGLEMYDDLSDKWIKIALNEGIWWNGKTSMNIDYNIKAGKHRVIIDKNQYKPRFTGWYEVSYNKQLNQKIIKEAIDMNESSK